MAESESNDIEVLGYDPRTSKASQITLIDRYWAVSEDYRLSILPQLQVLDIVACAAIQLEHERKDKALAVEAADARRQSGQGEPKPYTITPQGVAVFHVSGVMTKKPTSASFLTGGTSTIQLRAMIRAAKDDPAVVAGLTVFETPGGQCAGLPECADDFRAFNAAKPMHAFINDECASAGYYLASTCTSISMNRMGQAGCIGALAVIEDRSKMAEKMGVEVIVFKSEGSTFKGAGAPGTKITEEQRAMFQATVNHYGADFRDAVQTGRALSDEQLNAVAIGKMFTSEECLAMGLVDTVCSFEECLATISASADDSPSPAIAAQDPAKAPRAYAKDNPMNVKDILARLRGVDPDALQKAGIEASDLAALDGPDPQASNVASLMADMERMKTAALNQQAEAFWMTLITPDRDGRAFATWGEKPSLLATYKNLALLDGGGQLQYDAAGKFIVGPNLKTFVDGCYARTKNALQAEMIPDADPRAQVNGGLRMDMIHAAVKARTDRATADKVVGEKN